MQGWRLPPDALDGRTGETIRAATASCPTGAGADANHLGGLAPAPVYTVSAPRAVAATMTREQYMETKTSSGRRALRGLGLGALVALAAPVYAGELHLLTYGAPTVLGTQGNRHANVERFAVSDDGRHVAYATASNNLGGDDKGELTDVYVADLQTGVQTRASRRPDGGEPNGTSHAAAISGDGRWIAYVSFATDIVTTPVAERGVYLFDRDSGQTRLLTPPILPSAHAWPAEVDSLVVSADGARVAFVTDANLDPQDTDGIYDVYVWSRAGDTLEQINLDSTGQPLEGIVDTGSVAMSADGRHVSFSMRTSSSGTPEVGGVYVRDLQLATVDRVSGPTSVAAQSPTALSADARFVAFNTYESLLPADMNGDSDTYLFDRFTRAFELISVSDNGEPAGGFGAAISGDGRYLAFHSSSDRLEPGIVGLQIWRRDRTAGTTTRVTRSLDVADRLPWYDQPAMSRTSGHLVFDSNDEALVADDDNLRLDVFTVGLDGATRRVSQTTEAARLAGATTPTYPYGDAGVAVPLGDSGAAVLASMADNLGVSRAPGLFRGERGGQPLIEVPFAPLPLYPDLPVTLLLTGASADGSRLLVRREPFDFTGGWGPIAFEPWDLWRVSAAGSVRIDTAAAVGNGARTTQALLSDDGRVAVFLSLPPPVNGYAQPSRLYLHDADSGLLTRIDTNAQGVPADRTVQARIGLSRNGRYAAFVTAANNLVAGDADDTVDVFLRDNQTGELTRLRDPQSGAPLVGQAFGNSEAIAISDDATVIAFVDAQGEYGEIRRLRLLDRQVSQLSVLCGHAALRARCMQPTLSADGSVVAFATPDSLTPDDGDLDIDVYSVRRAEQWLQLESVDIHGQGGRGTRWLPRLSASGDTLTFQAIGGGWTTTPPITGDVDWLLTQVSGDVIFADGFSPAAD